MASDSSQPNITLKCEGESFPANRGLLSASSPVLSTLFSRRWQQEGDCREFSLSTVTATGLAEVLRILSGHPSLLFQDTMEDVLQAADFLEVAAVTRACEIFLSGSLEPGTMVWISDLARRYRLEGLEAECEDVILNSFAEVVATPEFLQLNFPRLLATLSDDRLVVRDEGEVWRAALAWLRGGGQGEDRKEDEVLVTVRYGLMDYSFFKEVVMDQGLVEENPAVHDLLREADEYHAAMSSPTRELADKLILKHGSTPHFALPRLPQEFLFTVGGSSSEFSAPSTSLDVYDSASDQWTGEKLELPLGLAYPTAQAVGDKIFVMGGASVDPLTHNRVASSRTVVLDVTKGTVENSVTMQQTRDSAASAAVDKTIFLFGGLGDDYSGLNSCEKLVTSQLPLGWRSIRPLGEDRAGAGAGAAAVGHSIYLTGGYSGGYRGATQRLLGSVVVYNTEQDRWKDGPRMRVAREYHGCAALGGAVYVAGGHDGRARLRSVERLLPEATVWESVADMLQPRSGFGLVTMDGRIYAVGGYTGSGSTGCVERFDPERNLWVEVSGLLEAKAYLAAVTMERRQLGEAAQRSYGSDMREDLMRRDLDRGLARGE